ncbi:hypothetical protein [Tunturibacter empetritectus]|uniref:Phage tail protein n=1 Tax=Tunturiibacter empetritectus TaxID=3069691 RepID=A0A7W8IEE4_9BACT|nr:hypothetical protein [Edaphobacter lichenicola]MBB5315654.1 putative phage tail protein [Edaphobacter lichenicola]
MNGGAILGQGQIEGGAAGAAAAGSGDGLAGGVVVVAELFAAEAWAAAAMAVGEDVAALVALGLDVVCGDDCVLGDCVVHCVPSPTG